MIDDPEKALSLNCERSYNIEHLHNIIIEPFGYGSHFDEVGATLVLCDEYFKESKENKSSGKLRVNGLLVVLPTSV